MSYGKLGSFGHSLGCVGSLSPLSLFLGVVCGSIEVCSHPGCAITQPLLGRPSRRAGNQLQPIDFLWVVRNWVCFVFFPAWSSVMSICGVFPLPG